MYTLHVSAIPNEANKEYHLNQSYQLFMIIKSSTRDDAINKAKQILNNKGWKGIKLQQIQEVSKEKEETSYLMDGYYLYIFSENEKKKLENYKEEAKKLSTGLEKPKK
jgi:hypothetical protein